MIVVRCCWDLNTNVPGSSQVSVTYQSQVRLQPKHDSSDILTCWLQSLKSRVCPASIPSPIVLWGLILATLTLLISALHQCPVCLCTIGQFSPHGTLISLTSSIDPHCETVQGFDLVEPTQILTYKQAQHKQFVRYSGPTRAQSGLELVTLWLSLRPWSYSLNVGLFRGVKIFNEWQLPMNVVKQIPQHQDVLFLFFNTSPFYFSFCTISVFFSISIRGFLRTKWKMYKRWIETYLINRSVSGNE